MFVQMSSLGYECLTETQRIFVRKCVHPLPFWTPRRYWEAWAPHREDSASSRWRTVPRALQHTALSPSWNGSPSEMCIQSTGAEDRPGYMAICSVYTVEMCFFVMSLYSEMSLESNPTGKAIVTKRLEHCSASFSVYRSFYLYLSLFRKLLNKHNRAGWHVFSNRITGCFSHPLL